MPLCPVSQYTVYLGKSSALFSAVIVVTSSRTVTSDTVNPNKQEANPLLFFFSQHVHSRMLRDNMQRSNTQFKEDPLLSCWHASLGFWHGWYLLVSHSGDLHWSSCFWVQSWPLHFYSLTYLALFFPYSDWLMGNFLLTVISGVRYIFKETAVICPTWTFCCMVYILLGWIFIRYRFELVYVMYVMRGHIIHGSF